MKILKIPAYYPTNKAPLAGIFVQDQVNALVRNGLQAAVIYPENHRSYLLKRSSARLFKEASVPVFRSKVFTLPKRNAVLLPQWVNPYRLLFKQYELNYGKPDILHGHTWWGGYVARLLSDKFQIPYVVTLHGSDFLRTEGFAGWKARIIREVFANAAGLISVSKALKGKIERYTPKEVVVIPNVVNTDFFHLKPIVSNSQEPAFRILAVGDLIPVKSFDLLLRAFAELIKLDPQMKLVIVGKGPLALTLSRLSHSLGIDQQLIFHPETDRIGLRNYYHHSDLLVSCSVHETFGLVIAEAMACGLPVVATNSGGPADLINNNNGKLIPIRDETSLVQSILEIKAHKLTYDSRLIRNDIQAYCGEEAFTRKILDFYHSVL